MYNYIQETAHSCAVKLVPSKGWSTNYGLTDLVDFVTDKIIARYIKGRAKGKPYSKEQPVTMIWFAVKAYAAAGVGTMKEKESPADINSILKYKDYY